MGLENFKFIFVNATSTFTPGQAVTGRIEFTLTTVKRIKSIFVTFKGEAHTSWTKDEWVEQPLEERRMQSVNYSGEEEYFCNKYYLLGEFNSEPIELPVGTHTYQFSFSLLPVLPSSFEGQYGYVRYTAKAVLDRPWKFDQTIKAAFTVISDFNLNQLPQLRESASLNMEKSFCFFCCYPGEIKAVIILPCTGFVPGQEIPFTIDIENMSRVNLMGVTFKLKKYVTFHTQTPRREQKTDKVIVKEVTFEESVPGKQSRVLHKVMKVPALPPSKLIHCNLIDIRYALKIYVLVDGLHSDLEGSIPITIGTIPLANMIPMTMPQEDTAPGSSSVIGWVPAPMSVPSPPEDPYGLPPPTYEECQFGTSSILDENDSEHTQFNIDRRYSPMYPVYNFNVMPHGPATPPPSFEEAARVSAPLL